MSNPHDYKGTAANAITTAKELQRKEVFLNLLALMPPEDELEYRLQHESVVQQYVDEDGEQFECRFLTLTAPGNSQLHLHLACGSGRKIDAELDHQPVALHASKFIGTVKPVVVCAAEAARWSRNEFTLDPWLRAIERLKKTHGHPAYLSMDGSAPIEFTRAAAMTLIQKTADAAAEVEDSRARMIKGIRRQIPASDLGGYCIYPLSQPPPPPLATVWMKSENGRRGVQRAAIVDNPAVRGELKKQIEYGLPKVYESDGTTPVDQLALVRQFLSLYARPEWPLARLIPFVVSRGLSTEGARRQHEDPSFDWRGQALTRNQIKAIAESIVKHLEYYRNGELFRRVGDKSAPEKTLTLMPPDGMRYLTDEDYDRIKTYKDEHLDRYRRAHHYTFGGQPATANGRPGFFVPEWEPDGTLTYRVRARATSDGSNAAASATAGDASAPSRPACRVPAVDFATSLMRGMEENHGDLRVFVPATVGPDTNECKEQLLRLEQTLKAKLRELDWREDQILPNDKRPGMVGRLLRRANDQYESLAREIDALKHDVVRAAEAAEREDRLHDPRTLEVSRFLDVVKTLKDPEDVTHHVRWRESIRDLSLTGRYVMVSGTQYARTEWAGTLLIHDEVDERAFAFSGWSDRRGTRARRAADVVIADLRKGDARRLRTPYWQSSAARELIRAALGVPSKSPLPVLTIRDPRLLRIAMEVAYPLAYGSRDDATTPAAARSAPTSKELADIARQLDEPVELVQRVSDLNPPYGHAEDASRKWETAGDQAVARVCRLAARHNGRLTTNGFDPSTWADLRHAAKRCGDGLFEFPRGRIVMRPCPHCGSFRREYLNIREATEPVCLACRLDTIGIAWPARRYNRYRTKPDR